MEDFFLPWRKFFFHGRFFLTMEDFFFPWMFFFNKTISLTPTKWVISIKQREIKEAPKRLISGRPPRGQREQGRLVEGEVAREASQRARHHATEARAGGGMRDWAFGKNSECNRCFSRMLKTAYRQAIRVISIKQRVSKEAPKRLISGSPRGADGSEVAWLVGAHGERIEPKSDRQTSHRAGGRGQHGAGLRFLRWRRSESAPRSMLNGKQ